MSERPALDDVTALAAWHTEQLGFGPTDMARRQAQTEQAQQARWGCTGLAILAIDENAEEVEHRGVYANPEDEAAIDELFAFIDES